MITRLTLSRRTNPESEKKTGSIIKARRAPMVGVIAGVLAMGVLRRGFVVRHKPSSRGGIA